MADPIGGLVVGIDPGLSGALAVLDSQGTVFAVEDLPTLYRGKGRVKHELDPAGLAHLLRPYAAELRLAVVEQVASRPGQGVASVFSLGHSYGAIVGTLAALVIPVRLVLPATWKAAVGLPAKAEKDASRALAARLFPGEPLHRVKDHNRAEALLLARYAQHLEGGQHGV